MRFIVALAFRYLKPRRGERFISFVSLFAVTGIVIGVAVLVIAFAVLDGFERAIFEGAVSFSAHIETIGFNRSPLANYPAAIEHLERDVDGVKLAAPFVLREAIIRSKEGMQGIVLKGIDSARNVSPLTSHIVQGSLRFATSRDDEIPIIISTRLARELRLDTGSTAALFLSQEYEGDKAHAARARVVATYQTGLAEYDENYVFTSLARAQELLGLRRTAVIGFDILLRDVRAADSIAVRIDRDMGYPYFSRSVFELYRPLFAWIDLQKQPIPIVLGLIVIVASFNLISVLLMFVLEKARAVGVLRALGLNARRVMMIFIVQGVVMSIVGVVGGIGVGVAVAMIQKTYGVIGLDSSLYFLSYVPIELHWSRIILVGEVALFISFVATVVPALAASRMNIVRQLREV